MVSWIVQVIIKFQICNDIFTFENKFVAMVKKNALNELAIYFGTVIVLRQTRNSFG